jgi:adenine-specific DNA-methyltransferase
MKYMGNKRVMLQNGLGAVLAAEAPKAKRFIDLFAGSASVAIHVASRFDVPVLAVDLQSYSAVLGNSVLHRQEELEVEDEWKRWHKSALRLIARTKSLPVEKHTIKAVKAARAWCKDQVGELTRAYGGHYFSPYQATALDALFVTMPKVAHVQTAAHAALIHAASKCAASPGHTAQPFQPTKTAKRFIFEAWDRDLMSIVESSLRSIAKLHSKAIGDSQTTEAVSFAAKQVQEGDLCFIDPPYSGVHYSRFYHVLESVARGGCGEVSGIGRYPATDLRPKSEFSKRSTALASMTELLDHIANAGASAIITFPLHECSNGMSGDDVKQAAMKLFTVEEKVVRSKFSSLGGNSLPDHRSARLNAKELILTLRQK